MRPPPPPPPQVVYVERKRGTSCLTWLVALIALPIGFVTILMVFHYSTVEKPKGLAPASQNPSPPVVSSTAPPPGDVVISKQSGKRVLGRCIVDATVKNTHKGAVRDITFAAIIRGESGKRLANLTYTATIRLKPGEVRTLKSMDFGAIPQQSARIDIGVLTYVRP